MSKKIISLFLICSMVFGIVSVGNAETAKKLAKGDLILIGTYNGSPVEYKVMGTDDVDGDGKDEFYLASTKIISEKPAMPSGGYGHDWGTYPFNGYSTSKGIALRAWLNSDSTPTVNYGYSTYTYANPYGEHPGFMSGMTDYEKSVIVEVTNNSYTFEQRAVQTDADATKGVLINKWPDTYTSMKPTDYYTTTRDKVFVPSIEELYRYFSADPYSADLDVSATDAAWDEYTQRGGTTLTYDKTAKRYWLRDKIVNNTDLATYGYLCTWHQTPSDKQNGTNVILSNMNKVYGVRPCMWLDDDATVIQGDDGRYRILSDRAYLTIADAENGYKKAKAYINNETENKLDVKLIMARYTVDNQLMELDDIKLYPLSVLSDSNADIASDNIYQKDGYLYRFFLWEKDSLTPLTDFLDYTVSEDDISYCYILYKWGILKNEPSDYYMSLSASKADASEFLNMIDAAAGELISSAESVVTGSEFYEALLAMLGYTKGTDYADTGVFLRSKGIGSFIAEKPFTYADMCNSLAEALSINSNSEDISLAQKLFNEGKMPQSVLTLLQTKFSKQSIWSLSDYALLPTANTDGNFTFSLNSDAKDINKFNFCYNVPYHYSGSYYGTLPESDPNNLRDEFDAALQKAGAKTLRFPGGNAVHYYFWEGESFGKKLMYDIEDYTGSMIGGFYDPTDPDDAYYTDFYNFMDFCKEYGYDVLLQINPSFFVDENGTDDTSDDMVRMAYPEVGVKTDADKNIIGTLPGYYDHNRIDEAAEQLRTNIRRMKAKGYNVTKWEIGNEDSYKNTGKNSYTDNQYVKDCFDAIIAYAKVINEEIDNPTIIIDGFDLSQALDSGLITDEEIELLDAVARHYPFSAWPGENQSSDDRQNPSKLVNINDVNFQKSYNDNVGLWALEPMVTETTAYRFQNWESVKIQPSFASALSTAHNWGQLVFDTGYSLTVMHDLESPWFGAVLHDVTYNPASKSFVRKYVGYTNLFEQDIPDSYKFDGRYFVSSAGKAFELLSRHTGEKVLTSSDSNVGRLISAYVSVNEKNLRLTVVNRLNETKEVNINLNDHTLSNQTVSANVIYSDDVRAVMESDYTSDTQVINLLGGDSISFDALPYSVTQFVVSLD